MTNIINNDTSNPPPWRTVTIQLDRLNVLMAKGSYLPLAGRNPIRASWLYTPDTGGRRLVVLHRTPVKDKSDGANAEYALEIHQLQEGPEAIRRVQLGWSMDTTVAIPDVYVPSKGGAKTLPGPALLPGALSWEALEQVVGELFSEFHPKSVVKGGRLYVVSWKSSNMATVTEGEERRLLSGSAYHASWQLETGEVADRLCRVIEKSESGGGQAYWARDAMEAITMAMDERVEALGCRASVTILPSGPGVMEFRAIMTDDSHVSYMADRMDAGDKLAGRLLQLAESGSVDRAQLIELARSFLTSD
jgi:hypothetical protein